MKLLRIESCIPCPFFVPPLGTVNGELGWCSNSHKYIEDSELPIPDWCPLEEAR